MLDFHKEYNSLLLVENQEGDEECFDEVDHNISVFKQKNPSQDKRCRTRVEREAFLLKAPVLLVVGRSSSTHQNLVNAKKKQSIWKKDSH